MHMLPKIPRGTQKVKRTVLSLGGINYTDNFKDGDMADCYGLSHKRFPYFTTKSEDKKQENLPDVVSFAFVEDKVLKVNTNGDFYYDGSKVGEGTADIKQFCTVGKKTCIFPDKKFLDFENPYYYADVTNLQFADFNQDMFYEYLKSKNISPVGRHSFTKTNAGVEYISEPINSLNGIVDIKDFGISNPKGFNNIIFDVSDNIALNLMEGKISGVGARMLPNNNCIRLEGTWLDIRFISATKDLGDVRFDYDKLKVWYDNDISDEDKLYLTQHKGIITYNGNEWTIVVREGGSMHTFPADALYYTGTPTASSQIEVYLFIDLTKYVKRGDKVVIREGIHEFGPYTVTNVYPNECSIYCRGIESTQSFTNPEIIVNGADKKIPDFEYVTESDNRLFGCEGQYIYVSALGNPLDFESNADSAIGAYTVAVGDFDEFTGCAKYESGVLFFKENMIYKLLGNNPKNFQLHSYAAEGVKKGCYRSITNVGGRLFYVGKHGVYVYSGGIPTLLSARLGEIDISDGVGGTDGEKYFLSCRVGEEKRFFVYDPKLNIWIIRENAKAEQFIRNKEKVYYLRDDGYVYLYDTADTDKNTPFRILFKPFYEQTEYKRNYSRIIIRAEIAKGAYIKASIRTDNEAWRLAGTIKGGIQNTTEIRLAPTRCDKFEILLEGQGKVTILSAVRESE